jgi:hypothetical protein
MSIHESTIPESIFIGSLIKEATADHDPHRDESSTIIPESIFTGSFIKGATADHDLHLDESSAIIPDMPMANVTNFNHNAKDKFSINIPNNQIFIYVLSKSISMENFINRQFDQLGIELPHIKESNYYEKLRYLKTSENIYFFLLIRMTSKEKEFYLVSKLFRYKNNSINISKNINSLLNRFSKMTGIPRYALQCCAVNYNEHGQYSISNFSIRYHSVLQSGVNDEMSLIMPKECLNGEVNAMIEYSINDIVRPINELIIYIIKKKEKANITELFEYIYSNRGGTRKKKRKTKRKIQRSKRRKHRSQKKH